jgi:hypothetical protein
MFKNDEKKLLKLLRDISFNQEEVELEEMQTRLDGPSLNLKFKIDSKKVTVIFKVKNDYLTIEFRKVSSVKLAKVCLVSRALITLSRLYLIEDNNVESLISFILGLGLRTEVKLSVQETIDYVSDNELALNKDLFEEMDRRLLPSNKRRLDTVVNHILQKNNSRIQGFNLQLEKIVDMLDSKAYYVTLPHYSLLQTNRFVTFATKAVTFKINGAYLKVSLYTKGSFVDSPTVTLSLPKEDGTYVEKMSLTKFEDFTLSSLNSLKKVKQTKSKNQMIRDVTEMDKSKCRVQSDLTNLIEVELLGQGSKVTSKIVKHLIIRSDLETI